MPRASDDKLREVGAFLESRMAAMSITRPALAERLGVTEQAIRNYLSGQREPRPSQRARMEDALDLPAGAIEAMLTGQAETPEPGIRLSASGIDLDELRRLDPEGYESIVQQAELLLRRARERRR